MGTEPLEDVLRAAAAQLRESGAIFGFVFEVLVPDGVDLLVLDGAPLELAGRVAMEGRVLFDDDPARRVRWVATTRKIYSDELPRIERSHREFAESLTRGR